MGKKSGKNELAKVDPVYVLGLDANGKPRGARFGELMDNICSAAMDMNCRVLIDQPEAVSALGMKLPVGRVHGGGKVVKLFVPTSGANSTTRYWKPHGSRPSNPTPKCKLARPSNPQPSRR
jgi:hypothetical protein